MDWQPIETAPRDGTNVLAWVDWIDEPGYEVGHFDEEGDFFPNHRGHKSMPPRGWIPLPPPPEQNK